MHLGQLCNQLLCNHLQCLPWEKHHAGGRGGGLGGGEWGGWHSISLLFEKSILLIKVQGYRGLTEKWKTVKKVHTLRYSVIDK